MTNNKRYPIVVVIGLLFVIYGLSFPSLTTNYSISIFKNIENSIDMVDSGHLLLSAFSYVLRNIIIFGSIYIGSMLIAHHVIKSNTIQFQLLFTVSIMCSIFLLNQLYIEYISYIAHLITIGILLMMQSLHKNQRLYYLSFSTVVLFLIISFQWLSLVPSLTPLHIGTNDFAVSLKIADSFLSNNKLFTTLFTVFFLIFFIIAIIFSMMVHLFSKQITTLKEYQRQAVELEETRIALVESKVYQEIHSLVHDLKTPLVTIEGLLSLITLKYHQYADQKLRDYFNRVDQSIVKMKEMISEIIYEDIKKEITPEELINYVISHISLDEQTITLEINYEQDLPSITVNKIRFARAISNLIENAIVSLKGKEGKISIDVKHVDNGIVIKVIDNGPGIKKNDIDKIWNEGYSTKNSSGIGLSFVKRVVENHQGNVVVTSIPDNYTEMAIFLPIDSEEDSTYDTSNR